MKLFNEYKSFNLRDKHLNVDWKNLKSECTNLHDWGVHILRPLLTGTAKCVVYEPHYVCKDHRNLYSNFYSKKHSVSSQYTSRLHFFSIPDVSIQDLIHDPSSLQGSYIGYSVIRPVAQRCIGRTVLDPLKLAKFQSRRAYFLRTGFQTHIGGQNFVANGYPYMSQDTDVTVCAHTALWGVCRYLSEKYSVYPEIYPFDLIKLTEPSQGRTFPYRGMTYQDYSNILSGFGTYPWIMWIQKPDPANPMGTVFNNDEFSDLCVYLESGFPILASYEGHVVTIIGHTIDYNHMPNADAAGFIESSSFCKQFIVVDDNFSPYQLLGDFDDSENYGSIYASSTAIGDDRGISMKSIVAAVCPLPEKVFLPAYMARDTARKYFSAYRNRICTNDESIVLRLFLTTSTSFQQRKSPAIDKDQFDVINYSTTHMNLPHFIWVMEAGPVSQYLQGKCTAEIVMDPTANQYDNAVIYLRLRNSLIYDGKEHVASDAPEEFSQYTHNLGEM